MKCKNEVIHLEDSEIVRLYWDRNEKAINAASEKYGGYCTSIAVNILGSIEDAEECVNDTYLNAWNTIPPQKPSMLSAFLGKIVRNLSFNRYNRIHSQKRGGHEMPLILDELSEIVSGKESVEDELTRKELVNEINRFIISLSDEKQYIFLRRYWYSDSIGAIAEKCGKTANAVSVELNRIRSTLRGHLTERGYDI